MSQSEETTHTDSALLSLGLNSTDPTPIPLDESPSDLNHSVKETDHHENNLEQQLNNLDLKEEEEEKDDVETQNDVEEEEDIIENENDDDVKKDEERRTIYPVRPEAEDCAYYMKTGLCKFGFNCKFNHPVRRKNQYYLRTGGCKFGKACRYNHSKQNSSVSPILELNFLGLPIRKGEKECPYYMRNGSCKYGANCRFNHPDPKLAGACEPPSGYSNGGSVSLQAASLVNMPSWSAPMTLNDSAAYLPIMFSPTQGVPPPNPEWNGYQVLPWLLCCFKFLFIYSIACIKLILAYYSC
ncbi:hypothetical protein V6Z12_D07G061600 [Gossypium hirsutum]